MGLREHYFPTLYRRWLAFRANGDESYIDDLVRRFYCMRVATAQRQLPMSVQVRTRLIRQGKLRYFNAGTEDKDLREQKVAFSKALELSTSRTTLMSEMQVNTSEKKASKAAKTMNNRKGCDEERSIPRKRDKQRNSNSKISKKLTLDEFFANIDEQKINELSSKSKSRKGSRAKIISERGQPQVRRLDPQYDDNKWKSRLRDQTTPNADLGVFF